MFLKHHKYAIVCIKTHEPKHSYSLIDWILFYNINVDSWKCSLNVSCYCIAWVAVFMISIYLVHLCEDAISMMQEQEDHHQ